MYLFPIFSSSRGTFSPLFLLILLLCVGEHIALFKKNSMLSLGHFKRRTPSLPLIKHIQATDFFARNWYVLGGTNGVNMQLGSTLPHSFHHVPWQGNFVPILTVSADNRQDIIEQLNWAAATLDWKYNNGSIWTAFEMYRDKDDPNSCLEVSLNCHCNRKSNFSITYSINKKRLWHNELLVNLL